jgi:hypothetical protein
MCETVPDFRKELRKNRFAWVIHGNGVQILNRESLKCVTVQELSNATVTPRGNGVLHLIISKEEPRFT